MKRKIPALLLALAMIAGLFGTSPAAAASDSDTELAMAVFEGLGAFEDGAMTASAAITRGEFARLLAYALGKGGEASSYARRTMYTVTLSGRSVERSDFVGSEYVDVDGTLYRISDDVQVYNTTTGTWYTDSASLGTALEQALAYSEDITVYYDRDADNGGRIRVVTVA